MGSWFNPLSATHPTGAFIPLAGYLSDKWDPGILVVVGMRLITLGIGVSIMSYKWLNF